MCYTYLPFPLHLITVGGTWPLFSLPSMCSVNFFYQHCRYRDIFTNLYHLELQSSFVVTQVQRTTTCLYSSRVLNQTSVKWKSCSSLDKNFVHLSQSLNFANYLWRIHNGCCLLIILYNFNSFYLLSQVC